MFLAPIAIMYSNDVKDTEEPAAVTTVRAAERARVQGSLVLAPESRLKSPVSTLWAFRTVFVSWSML